jgi:hypothetical protein
LVDFPSTTYAAFGIYRYPAKFIPHVVAYVLKNYAHPGTKVFDPFAGYGTVGVVSRLYDCDYELWDLNPIIEVLHRVTMLEPREIPLRELMDKMASSEEEFVPEWSNFSYWFPPEFVPVLTRAWGFYHSLDDEYTKSLLAIPLLKASRDLSFDDMGRMKLSRSPKSKQRIDQLMAGDWKTKFYGMVRLETENVLRRLSEYQSLAPRETKGVVRGGIDTLSTELDEEKDILITSPPYLQSQEYIRQAKMDLFWLGHSESEIKKLSTLEIPYRKLPSGRVNSPTFSAIRNEIEEEHMRNVYDYYFHGVLGALSRLQDRITSRLFLFVGRSSLRGRSIPIDSIFVEHLTEMGWVHEKTLIDKIVARRVFSYRVNPATNIEDRRTATENLVILRRAESY